MSRLLIYMSLFCCGCIPTIASNSPILIDSIVVKKIPWGLMTPADIHCDNLENLNYKEYHIKDKQIIYNVIKEIENLKESPIRVLNARCKVSFYQFGKIISDACIGGNNTFYQGKLYMTSTELMNMIDSLESFVKPVKTNTKEKINEMQEIPYPNGRDSLYSYLSSLSMRIAKYVSDTISVNVLCAIDYEGNSSFVRVKHRNPSQIVPKELEKELMDIFMEEIKWLPKKERFPYELVIIPMTIYP